MKEEYTITLGNGVFREGDKISFSTESPACCMRRARARYWRIARGYFGLGATLGVAVGMFLGALSKVCQ